MATRAEKIEEILDSTTRQDKVDRMLESVNDWDTETMVSWIQGKITSLFNDMDEQQIKDEYECWFDNEFDDIEDDEDEVTDDDYDDDELFCDDDEEEETECVCEWEVVYQQGCQCGGR